MNKHILSAMALCGALALPATAFAADGEYWWSGDWYLKVGAAGFVAPSYEGDNNLLFQATPMISIGRQGSALKFSSRNDNPAFALLDSGTFRAGVTGKLVMPRDEDTSEDLKGLDPIKLGLEAGVFAEAYPTDWLRLRAELRRGIRSHSGMIADIAADAYTDITPEVRLSAGPRVTFASDGYVDAFYGVNATEARKSGLSRYDAKGGLHSAGFGAAINWKLSEQVETSAFAEYKRLMGSAADSSLVKERGSRDQFLIGLSATYQFNFNLP